MAKQIAFVPWTEYDISPLVRVDSEPWEREHASDIRAALDDGRFMGAAGFSGPIYYWDDNLASVRNFGVWEEVNARLSQGWKYVFRRINDYDHYAWIDGAGKLRGYVYESYRPGDDTFWKAAQLVKGVVTAGIATAADTATMAAEQATEHAAQSTVTESLTMDFDFGSFDFGEYDYGSVFDSFDFTSGEGFQVFSDAQNVDFGFGGGFGDFSTGIDWGNIPEDLGFNFESTIDWGGTLESAVSDFGTWWSNPALEPIKDEAQKAIMNKAVSTFIKPPPPSPPRQQTPITTKSIANGVSDLAGAAMQLIGVRNAYSSTAPQRETAVNQRYTGQLAPGGRTVAVENSGMNPWLLGAIALVAVGGIWYVSRKG